MTPALRIRVIAVSKWRLGSGVWGVASGDWRLEIDFREANSEMRLPHIEVVNAKLFFRVRPDCLRCEPRLGYE